MKTNGEEKKKKKKEKFVGYLSSALLFDFFVQQNTYCVLLFMCVNSFFLCISVLHKN